MSAVPGPGDLRLHRAELLRFAAQARCPGGFGWLRDDGTLDDTKGVELWITCRMTHVAALGLLAADPPAPGGPTSTGLAALAAHGVDALGGPLRDTDDGGWFATIGPDGPRDTRKQAYGHAFVVLATSSAAAAGIPAAASLLAEALAVSESRFWDDRAGLSVDEWDRSWSHLQDYRGVNANMHTVEAYLAAGDVTGDPVWHERAGRVALQVASWAQANDWRIPEHFSSTWRPALEHNKDRPDDPFRPYGATVGHGLEWARLFLAVDATLEGSTTGGLQGAATALYSRAVADGWAVDGADGFVYTTDWDGRPVVRQRMHWVVAEAVNAAEALWRVTGDERYRADAMRWWSYADRYLVDREAGSWHHELDADNRPASSVWTGKPDVYHAYQAALLPSVPLVPSFASALAARHGPADQDGNR